MKRTSLHLSIFGGCVLASAVGIALVKAVEPPKQEEHLRKIKGLEAPTIALEALKKMAGGSAITQFSEEIEHGVTYYEGSWKGPNGNVDALVTAQGDLIEIEEAISLSDVPKSILEKAQAATGKDTELFVEKKTIVLYEVKYRKDNRKHEVVYSADGREHEHEDEGADAGDDD